MSVTQSQTLSSFASKIKMPSMVRKNNNTTSVDPSNKNIETNEHQANDNQP